MAYWSGSVFLEVVAACFICLATVSALLTYLQHKWTRKGIPFSNVHPIFGNIKDVVLGRKIARDVILEFYLMNKCKPFIGFFSFSQPSIMINDIELVKKVLISDFSAFSDRNFSASASDPMQYHNMFTMKGQDWKNLRVKLTPTFTSGRIKMMFEYVDACGKCLVTCLEKERGKDGEVEIKELCARFTTDVIATCAFGIEGNALNDSESLFRRMLKKSVSLDFAQNLVALLMFFFPWAVKKFNLSLTKPDVTDFFRNTTWNTVEYRENNDISRNDFLNLLIQLKKTGSLKDDDSNDNGQIDQPSNDKIDLDGDKFVAQCFLFLVAGFETSSLTMSSALYEMALNHNIQNRVYKEIQAVLAKHDGKVTYKAVQEMTYLHMVIQETLRKYPFLLFLDRRVTRSYRLPGTAIELSPGDAVMIPVIGIHYDPDIYPEPNRFDPERFSEENRRARPACAFLGFGDGPRNCIGMRMGYLQTKVGLIYTLLEYKISPAPSTKVPLAFRHGVFLQADGGIQLRLRKRNI